LEVLIVWSLLLAAFPSHPPANGTPFNHVPAIGDYQDRALDIGNPYPETWPSFEDDLANVLPIDSMILDNDPASAQHKLGELLALQQPDPDPMVFSYDFYPSGQNLEPVEASFEPLVSGSQLNITTNPNPTYPEGIDLVQETPTRFSEDVREMLNNSFAQELYPSKATIADISRRTQLTEKQVKNWFVNKRSRTTKNGANSHITHYSSH
jgi:hypothetical protein